MRNPVLDPLLLPEDPVESYSPVTWRCHGLRALSILLFLTSLGAQGLRTDPIETDFSNGFSLLFIGWMGLLEGVAAWIANPCLILTWILMSSRSVIPAALATSTVALGFAASLLLYDTIPDATSQGYRPLTIVSLGQAYWFWIASIAVAVVGTVWEWLKPLAPLQTPR